MNGGSQQDYLNWKKKVMAQGQQVIPGMPAGAGGGSMVKPPGAPQGQLQAFPLMTPNGVPAVGGQMPPGWMPPGMQLPGQQQMIPAVPGMAPPGQIPVQVPGMPIQQRAGTSPIVPGTVFSAAEQAAMKAAQTPYPSAGKKAAAPSWQKTKKQTPYDRFKATGKWY